MGASGSTSWYLAPARAFPAKVWLEQRFPFRVSIPPHTPAGWKPTVHIPAPTTEVAPPQVRRLQSPLRAWGPGSPTGTGTPQPPADEP